MNTDQSIEDRIADLAAEAHAARASFEPPASPPDVARAKAIASEHVGPVAATFVEIRTGGRSVYLPPASYDRLEAALNEWLRQYAACYGVEMVSECQVRTAAQLLVDTHNAHDVARILTGVPERHSDEG